MKYLLSVSLVFFATQVLAQKMKLAGVEYVNYPKVKVKDDGEDFEVAFQEFLVYANYPKVLKNKKTVLINGFSYAFVKSQLYNDNLSIDNSEIFHRIAYTITVIHRWDEDWTLSARLAPTLASDFEEKFSKDDFILQGSLLAVKNLNQYKKFGGGLIYTTRLGKPFLLPAVQYYYEKDKHYFHAFFPAFIDYAYHAGAKEKLDLGFRIGINGSNFNVGQSTYTNAEVDRLNYVRVNIGPTITYKLTKMLQLEAFGGLNAKRIYKFEDAQGNTFDFDSERSPFINIGLTVVPDRKRKN